MPLYRWALISVFAAALATCSSKPDLMRITIHSKEFAYNPAEIEARAGETVELTLDNQGTVEHDFTLLDIPIEEGVAVSTPAAEHDVAPMEVAPKIHVAAPAGESAAIVFTPTKPGSYSFNCTVPGHKENGMAGTLKVLQP